MKNLLILLSLGFAVSYVIQTKRLPSLNSNITNPNCIIKGNISINSGQKIYHLPGQEDYENTRIQREHGERWFCSEKEAIDAGWTKAPR